MESWRGHHKPVRLCSSNGKCDSRPVGKWSPSKRSTGLCFKVTSESSEPSVSISSISWPPSSGIPVCGQATFATGSAHNPHGQREGSLTATGVPMEWEASDRARRLAGLAGLAGALLFFAGDMLFYGYFGSGAGFREGLLATVRQSSRERLFAGGLVGPVAACLCIVGFWHVYLDVRPSQERIARLMLVAFAVLMVFGSAIHVLWATRGFALKYCYGSDDAGCRALLKTVNSYWELAYNIGAVPGYVGAMVLFGLVLLGKTWYPRWTALANPAVLMLLSPLADRTPAPFGAVLSGGFTNLSIALFFLVSVWTTWKQPKDDGPRKQG